MRIVTSISSQLDGINSVSVGKGVKVEMVLLGGAGDEVVENFAA